MKISKEVLEKVLIAVTILYFGKSSTRTHQQQRK